MSGRPKMGSIHLVSPFFSFFPPVTTTHTHTAEMLEKKKKSPPLWPGVVLELEEVMEAVDAVVGSRPFTAALVALWVAGAWKGKVEWFHGIFLPAVGRTAASERVGVVWKGCDCGYPVWGFITLPLYSSVYSSLVWAIISAEWGFSLRRMYGCTEVPYSTSDHSFSLPAATRAVWT